MKIGDWGLSPCGGDCDILMRMSVRPKLRRVIVLLETSLGVSRDILKGIIRYSREHEPWILELTSGGVGDLRLPQGWRGDGIISRSLTEKEMAAVLGHPAPKVLMDVPSTCLANCAVNAPVVRFESDYYATGREAADYFLARGFRNFVFFGESRSTLSPSSRLSAQYAVPEWSELRCRGFCDRLAACGHYVTVLKKFVSRRESESWHLERPRVIRLLQDLPKPLAVFTPTDARGRQILDACQVAGIAAPSAVAVLAVNNDRTLCETSVPQLSSIPLRAEEAGYDAAAALDRLMKGARSSKKVRIYGHLPVVTRDSTLNHQTDDPLVVAALSRIHEAEGFGLRASELAGERHTTLRTLEKHFMRALGRSVGDVLRETCLEHVRRLVTTTDLPFRQIAARAGHLSASHLSDVYRRRFGRTMGDDRKGRS